MFVTDSFSCYFLIDIKRIYNTYLIERDGMLLKIFILVFKFRVIGFLSNRSFWSEDTFKNTLTHTL